MKAWLSRLHTDLVTVPSSPGELARFELSHALPDISCSIETDPSMGEGYHICRKSDGSFLISGGSTGILYGSYALIRSDLCENSMPDNLSSSPRYALRMINCWDNMDGSIMILSVCVNSAG